MKRNVVLLVAAIAFCSTVAASQIRFGIQATGTDLDIGKKLGIDQTGTDPRAQNVQARYELTDVYAFGYGGGVHLDINLPILFAIRVQGDYVTFMPSETKYRAKLVELLPGTKPEDWRVDGGRINAWTVFANAKLSPIPLPIISPYITGGIGLANIGRSDAQLFYQNVKLLDVKGTDAITSTSANAGIGADIGLGGVDLYAEVRLTWIFTEGGTTSMLPLGTVGLTF